MVTSLWPAFRIDLDRKCFVAVLCQVFNKHSSDRYVSTYLAAFFSLPVKTLDGSTLTHEEIINRLDNETVSYEVGNGLSGSFQELVRVSIKVETAAYEKAVAWIRDLVYGLVFDKERYVCCCHWMCAFAYPWKIASHRG